MERILDFLNRLDVSETEAKLYLSLLETGPISVRELAQRIGLKRTTAYLYIDNLMAKGLITKDVVSSRTQISPIQPTEGLTELVKKTTDAAKEAETKLHEIVDEIRNSLHMSKETDQFEVKSYKGINGLKTVYEEALKANEFRSYVKIVEDDLFADNIGMFDKAFKNNPNLHVKELLYKTSNAGKEAELLHARHSRYTYKYMPEDMKLTSEDILIFDGKVALIHGKDRQSVNSVILNSTEYYKNSVEFFDFIWKMLPETK